LYFEKENEVKSLQLILLADAVVSMECVALLHWWPSASPGHCWWSAADVHQLLPAAFALLVFLRVLVVDSVAGGGGSSGGVGLGAVPFSSRTMRRPPRVSLDLASNSTCCCCWITALTVVDAAAACCRFERRVGVSDEPGGGVDDSSRDRFSLGCVVSRVPWPGTEVMLTTLTAVVLWFGLLHLKDNTSALVRNKIDSRMFWSSVSMSHSLPAQLPRVRILFCVLVCNRHEM
jgi:hypothetical protein